MFLEVSFYIPYPPGCKKFFELSENNMNNIPRTINTIKYVSGFPGNFCNLSTKYPLLIASPMKATTAIIKPKIAAIKVEMPLGGLYILICLFS